MVGGFIGGIKGILKIKHHRDRVQDDDGSDHHAKLEEMTGVSEMDRHG